MADLIKGKNAIVRMQIDGEYFPVFCAKSAEFTSDQEEYEVTNINSGPFRNFVPGMNSSMLNITGAATMLNTGGKVSIDYLLQESIRRTIFPMDIAMTDDAGNTLEIAFNAFIRNTTFSRETSAYSQCSASFRISDGIEFSESIPPPGETTCDEVQPPLYLTLAEGETTVSSIALAGEGVTVLEVCREGVEYDIITSGTPTGVQVLWDGSDLTFLNAANPGGERIYVLYKVTA